MHVRLYLIGGDSDRHVPAFLNAQLWAHVVAGCLVVGYCTHVPTTFLCNHLAATFTSDQESQQFPQKLMSSM